MLIRTNLLDADPEAISRTNTATSSPVGKARFHATFGKQHVLITELSPMTFVTKGEEPVNPMVSNDGLRVSLSVSIDGFAFFPNKQTVFPVVKFFGAGKGLAGTGGEVFCEKLDGMSDALCYES